MRISFGTYSLRIKTYNFKDLNLENSYKDVNFHLYQKVFFILLIPFAPTEKFWKIKNTKTNENIVTNAELRTKLNLILLKRKSPLWSYSGSIILIAPFVYLLGLLIYNFSENQFHKNQNKSQKDEINSETLKKINNPTLNDIYYVKMVEQIAQRGSNGRIKNYKRGRREDIQFRLFNFSNDSLKLKLSNYPKYYISDLKLKDTILTTKQDITTIISKYRPFIFYKKKTKNDLDAIFRITKIAQSKK